MQRGNVFNNRPSFLSRNPEPTSIIFHDCLNSIDSEDMCFTNFCSSKECKNYKNVDECYKKVLNQDFSFLDKEFTNTEYTMGNESKNERLKNLISLTLSKTINDNDLYNVVKYKNKTEKEFQLFIKYNPTADVGEVYLIDLYHFVLPTEDKRFGQRRTDNKSHYERMRRKVKNNVNLSCIIEDNDDTLNQDNSSQTPQ